MPGPVSPNFDQRAPGLSVDMLVIHYTGMETAEAALKRLCDPKAKVSAHYMIGEDGTVLALVDESKRAWHAGVASWRGEADVNGRSIGIELVNPGHEFGYRPFPEAQMAALEKLAKDILARHPIAPANVVGHADVAPARKRDPGELFDWRRLARAGVGLWVEDAPPIDVSTAEAIRLLSAFGYDVDDPVLAVCAFQRHFRPRLFDGEVDGETGGLLTALLDAA